MPSRQIVSIRKVRFSDGGTFETRADSAFEYIFNPVFMRFVFLGAVILGALIDRGIVGKIDPVAELILWSAGFFTTIAWIFFAVSINVWLYDRGVFSAIFTPLIVLPLAGVNLAVEVYMAHLLWPEMEMSQTELYGDMIRNLFALCAFDILHGRFVAPAHPTYVHPEGTRAAAPVPQNSVGPAVVYQQTEAEQPQTPETMTEGGTTADADPAPDQSALLELSKQAIPIKKIEYIKSEGHYLKVQLDGKNHILRGKLSDAVDNIDTEYGAQINRSVWVAFHAIDTIDDSDSRYLTVTIKDGTDFRVAASRTLVFKQNFERFKETQ